MNNKTATNVQRSNFNNLANTIDYTFTQKMFDINTLMVCVFDGYITGTSPAEYGEVTQLINNVDVTGKPLQSPMQFSVPIGYLMGGNAGIHITYKKGDLVLVGYSQQSLAVLKNSWNKKLPIGTSLTPNPQINNGNYGKFTLEDGIILCKISSTLPTTKIDIQETGITITGNNQPVIINSGNADTTINANKAIINAQEVNVNSNNINLGSSGGSGVLTGGTSFTINGTVTTGSGAGGVVTGTATPNNPSTKVKAVL